MSEYVFTDLFRKCVIMRNLIRYIVSILMLLTLISVNAQVFFSEDFESYNLGAFTSNSKGWDVTGVYNSVRIVSEPGRGKVLAWGWNTMPLSLYGIARCAQQNDFLKEFEKRDPGNDILKLEFDFCSRDFTGAPAELFESNVGSSSSGNYFRCRVNANESAIDSSITNPKNYKIAYNHSWIKVEVYFVYLENTDTWEVHTYIPVLGYWSVESGKTLTYLDLYIGFSVYKANQSPSGVLIKYDNIKISAIPNLPAFANINEWLSSKFNIYPNPATNITNITNTDNVLVNRITIYDINGKRLSVKSFNNEQNIQLNIENLTSGIYILHLHTNQGLAVKKLVKK